VKIIVLLYDFAIFEVKYIFSKYS